ncbi:MAG: hypothetical protein HYS57_01020, partial [Parcubacteria group bacterium]|nr:hypothetical protein [Parcubacteria group bacterium]
VSYFEWLQNRKGESWTTEKVNSQLEEILKKAFASVRKMGKDAGTDLRRAAYLLAVQRVAHSTQLRATLNETERVADALQKLDDTE